MWAFVVLTGGGAVWWWVPALPFFSSGICGILDDYRTTDKQLGLGVDVQ